MAAQYNSYLKGILSKNQILEELQSEHASHYFFLDEVWQLSDRKKIQNLPPQNQM